MENMRNAADPTRMLGASGWNLDYSRLNIMIDKTTNTLFAYDKKAERRLSIKELETLAKEGHADAQCAMADYYSSEGKNFNPAQSNFWYEKAALQGNPKAQGFLAGNYLNGLGLDRDLKKAEHWAKKAAAQNSPPGMVILSQCFLASEDYANVILWLEKAKSLGFADPDGLLEMAKLLYQANTKSKESDFSDGLLGLSRAYSANQIKERNQKTDNNKLDEFRNHVLKNCSIYSDKRNMQLVADVFSGDERLINALRIAIEGNVSAQLAKLKPLESTQHEACVKRIFYSFIEAYGLDKTRAIDAFHVLLVGLGMDSRTLNTFKQ